MRFDYKASYTQDSSYSLSLYCGGELTVYTKDVYAVGFVGRAKKPTFNYRFKSVEDRDAYISRMVASVESRKSYKAEVKQARKTAKDQFKAALKPGVILSASWGYEQTQVEFYQVMSISGSKVTLQELGHIEGESKSWASCDVMPDLESKVGSPITKTVASAGIRIDSSVVLSLWDGKPKYKSWYY